MFAAEKKRYKKMSKGSALILTVVLTSLLAIVGTLFLMSSRIERMASSAVTEEKQLSNAIDNVVEVIKSKLRSDVPGVPGVEYEDYPGPQDVWLASTEPYTDGTNYLWRQVSNLKNNILPV